MPRGKKTSPETVYNIMTVWMTTNNYKETARQLELPVTTVKDIVDRNKDLPEFVKLRNEKMAEFSNRASELIQKSLVLLNRRLDRAIASEEDLDLLIDEIYATDKEELSQDEKRSLVLKIRALQLQDFKALTTSMCMLYDKKALADGKPTGRTELVGVDGEKLSKLAELAGYVKQ